MLFWRSFLFPIFFSAHTASDSDTRNHSRFPAPTGKGQRGISSAAFQHGVTDGSWGGGTGRLRFFLSVFFWRMGKGTRRWDRGEGPWCIQEFLGLFLISKHCKTTTQTSKQPCQTLARTRPLHTDVDGWLGSLKKEETRGRGGSVRHTKPLVTQSHCRPRQTDRQEEERRPTPPRTSLAHNAHIKKHLPAS